MILANGPDAEERRLQAGLHVLTVQTMLMFLIAIFYDVEYPTDDGTCGTYVDEKSCLSERSMFDTSTTTCEWNLSDDGGGSCMWVEPTISYKVQYDGHEVCFLLTDYIGHCYNISPDSCSHGAHQPGC